MSGISLTLDVTGFPAIEAMLARLEQFDGGSLRGLLTEGGAPPDGVLVPAPPSDKRRGRAAGAAGGALPVLALSAETVREIETIVVDDLGNLLS